MIDPLRLALIVLWVVVVAVLCMAVMWSLWTVLGAPWPP